MKVVLSLLVLVALAYAVPEKRFIESIAHAFQDLGHSFEHAFNSAKDTFHSFAHNLDFSSVVNALIPLIDSNETEGGCISVCETSASSLLGSAAPLATSLCPSACKGALSKLEETAGR